MKFDGGLVTFVVVVMAMLGLFAFLGTAQTQKKEEAPCFSPLILFCEDGLDDVVRLMVEHELERTRQNGEQESKTD